MDQELHHSQRARLGSGQPVERAAGERHSRHLESVTSHQKSDSANRCAFI